jgi:hypothetical protein
MLISHTYVNIKFIFGLRKFINSGFFFRGANVESEVRKMQIMGGGSEIDLQENARTSGTHAE